MTRVFVSYRRDDTREVAGRLTERLRSSFGKRNVFMDVVSLSGGMDFERRLVSEIERSDVVIALIGPAWERQSRTDVDWVHTELATALSSGKTVVPVLWNGRAMPRRDDVPTELDALLKLHAVVLRPDPDFDHDARRLIQHLRPGGRIHRTLGSAAGIGRVAAIALIALLLAWLVGRLAFGGQQREFAAAGTEQSAVTSAAVRSTSDTLAMTTTSIDRRPTTSVGTTITELLSSTTTATTTSIEQAGGVLSGGVSHQSSGGGTASPSPIAQPVAPVGTNAPVTSAPVTVPPIQFPSNLGNTASATLPGTSQPVCYESDLYCVTLVRDSTTSVEWGADRKIFEATVDSAKLGPYCALPASGSVAACVARVMLVMRPWCPTPTGPNRLLITGPPVSYGDPTGFLNDAAAAATFRLFVDGVATTGSLSVDAWRVTAADPFSSGNRALGYDEFTIIRFQVDFSKTTHTVALWASPVPLDRLRPEADGCIGPLTTRLYNNAVAGGQIRGYLGPNP